MEIEDLDAAATLACAHESALDKRRTEIRDLELAAHWCDLHAVLPRDTWGGVALTPRGRPMLVQLGGEGTQEVNDLSLCELGVARGTGTLSAHNLAADALDLRTRLPLTWARVKTLQCDVWLARKIASMTRHLAYAVVGLVDRAVADAITGQSPSKVLDLCHAKIIEADPAAHAQRIADEERRRYATLGRIDEHGLQHLIARITAGDAHAIDQTLDRVAAILAADPDTHGVPDDADRGLLRSLAMGWLARPVDLLTLLLAHPESDPEPVPGPLDRHDDDPYDGEAAETPGPTRSWEPAEPEREPITALELLDALRQLDLELLRPTAILYLHLTTDALERAVVDGIADGVVRVERLGPHTIEQLTTLLGHSRVVVKPVIDLNEQVSTAAYEFPDPVTERVLLTHPGDAFPHATGRHTHAGARVDIDHPVPWTRDGPPDQTNSRTGQPLSRRSHRAKTHLGYRCTPLSTGERLWVTPHGLHKVVDHTGTHTISKEEYAAWTGPSVVERALARTLHRHRAGLV